MHSKKANNDSLSSFSKMPNELALFIFDNLSDSELIKLTKAPPNLLFRNLCLESIFTRSSKKARKFQADFLLYNLGRPGQFIGEFEFIRNLAKKIEINGPNLDKDLLILSLAAKKIDDLTTVDMVFLKDLEKYETNNQYLNFFKYIQLPILTEKKASLLMEINNLKHFEKSLTLKTISAKDIYDFLFFALPYLQNVSEKYIFLTKFFNNISLINLDELTSPQKCDILNILLAAIKQKPEPYSLIKAFCKIYPKLSLNTNTLAYLIFSNHFLDLIHSKNYLFTLYSIRKELIEATFMVTLNLNNQQKNYFFRNLITGITSKNARVYIHLLANTTLDLNLENELKTSLFKKLVNFIQKDYFINQEYAKLIGKLILKLNLDDLQKESLLETFKNFMATFNNNKNNKTKAILEFYVNLLKKIIPKLGLNIEQLSLFVDALLDALATYTHKDYDGIQPAFVILATTIPLILNLGMPNKQIEKIFEITSNYLKDSNNNCSTLKKVCAEILIKIVPKLNLNEQQKLLLYKITIDVLEENKNYDFWCKSNYFLLCNKILQTLSQQNIQQLVPTDYSVLDKIWKARTTQQKQSREQLKEITPSSNNLSPT